MTNFPWLTVIGLIPLIGAAVVAALPAGLTDRAKHIALGISLVTLVLGIAAALQFETELGRAVPARRAARVDPAVRGVLRPRASTASRWS